VNRSGCFIFAAVKGCSHAAPHSSQSISSTAPLKSVLMPATIHSQPFFLPSRSQRCILIRFQVLERAQNWPYRRQPTRFCCMQREMISPGTSVMHQSPVSYDFRCLSTFILIMISVLGRCQALKGNSSTVRFSTRESRGHTCFSAIPHICHLHRARAQPSSLNSPRTHCHGRGLPCLNLVWLNRAQLTLIGFKNLDV